MSNAKVILVSRPGADNVPMVSKFRYEACSEPDPPGQDEVTINTLFLSLDPALRCRMNDSTGVDYMKEWAFGETVLGLGGVGMVTASGSASFAVGDMVQAMMNWPWLERFNTRVDSALFPLYKLEESLKDQPQLVLSLLGLTGLTSYLGVKQRGHLSSDTKPTFVVSGAAGLVAIWPDRSLDFVGAARVVGICGSDEKCRYLESHLGFDSAVNYKLEHFADRLSRACPDGVNCYFDNVGGDVSECVIRLMSPNSHVILCGQIAVYNKDLPYPPPISEEIQSVLAERNITRERFLVLAYEEQFTDALRQLQQWYSEGKLKVPEFVHEGLKSATQAFVDMMTSVRQTHVGKQIVRVS